MFDKAKLEASRIRRVSGTARAYAARTRAGAVLVAAIALGAAASAGAQQSTPPVPIDQAPPEQPMTPFNIPLEGWAKVRYTVLADGTTADVRVVDSLPSTLPTKGIESAVESWTFTPASVGGEAVEWHNNESVIVFDIEMVPLEVSPFLAEAFVDINEMIEEQDYEKALRRNRQTMTRATRLYEIGVLEMQAAFLNIQLSNLHDAHASIMRATDPRAPSLPPDDLANALRYRFGIAVELGRYADALETHERLEEIAPLPDGDPMSAQVEAIEQALGTDAAIVVKGYVDRQPWTYAPTRRTFAFVDVDGEVRTIDLECDRRKATLEFSADAEWSVPESWGACTMQVNARRNTTFSLVEFP